MKTTDDAIARKRATTVDKRTKGTGHWIEDDFMSQAREQEKAPILWLFSNLGIRRTMLAARTVGMLQNRYPQHSDLPPLTLISYSYLKDDNPALQDCAQRWKAAALQSNESKRLVQEARSNNSR